MNYNYKFCFILVALIFLVSCKQNTTEPVAEEEVTSSSNIKVEKKQFTSSKFELGTLLEKEFDTKLSVTGKIHLPEKSKAAVSSLLEGTVGAVNWMEGQWVKKGATLFSVTNPELINMQEDYLIAQGQLEYLNEEFNRQQQLAAENITTKKDLLKAKSTLATNEAKYNAVKQKLNLYGIKTELLSNSNLVSSLSVVAPISGYITDINILRGSFLKAATPALKISNNSQIHLELSVLEKDASLLSKDLDISFYIQNDPTRLYKAKVQLVKKRIDENKMVTAVCRIEDKKLLMPGMHANADIILDKQANKSLPLEAVVKMGNDSYVLKLVSQDDAGYEFEQVQVELGEESNGFVSISNLPLDASQYLLKGAYFLIQ